MTCKNNEIQALLPAHLEHSLDGESQSRVELHMAACEDCRAELALLQMMSEEPVPDQGEAFWAAMPGKIFREVQAQKQRNTSRWLPFGSERFIVPRWAWAAAAVFLVASVVLLLDRPAPLDSARTTLPENGSSYADLLPAEPFDMAELNDVEIDSVDIWATEELALLREEIVEIFRTSTDISIDDRLADMNSQELEQLSKMLDTQGEEG